MFSYSAEDRELVGYFVGKVQTLQSITHNPDLRVGLQHAWTKISVKWNKLVVLHDVDS